MITSHVFRLRDAKPHNRSDGGERVKVDRSHFPILRGMALYQLHLAPRGIREPHWHVNADELGYCLQGDIRVTFFHTENNRQSFFVRKGEAFWIPSGALHTIENLGQEEAQLLLEFSHEMPEEFHVSSAIGMFSNAVLGNTWGVGQDHFQTLHRPLKDRFAVRASSPPSLEHTHSTSPYHYALENATPLLDKSSGSVRVARKDVWPMLNSHSLYSLRITSSGMREPHWHPETAELGFVRKGHARMSVQNPEGAIETYCLQPGDVYFIPKAYPHHIENIGQGALHFLIFFDQAMPQDVGFSGSIRAMTDQVLSSVLHVKPSFFAPLSHSKEDAFLVDQINSSLDS